MQTLDQIKSKLVTKRDYLFSHYPINTLDIFGSYTRGDEQDDSDIDILVEFNDSIGIEFIDFAEEIEKLLGFKVDLVSRGGIKDKCYNVIKDDLIYV